MTSSPSHRASLGLDLRGRGGRVGVSPGVGNREGILLGAEGRGGIFRVGTFLRSVETGGVRKTDETEFDAFFLGVEVLSIVFREKVAVQGVRSAASSPIRAEAAFRNSLQNRIFSRNLRTHLRPLR